MIWKQTVRDVNHVHATVQMVGPALKMDVVFVHWDSQVNHCYMVFRLRLGHAG